MGHAQSKRERIEQMEQMLLSAPEDGIGLAQIANQLACDPSTAHRYLAEIEIDNPLIQVSRGRYRLDPSQYISNVRLHPAEALSIYLALRRYIRQTTNAPDFMISALQKVAHTLRHSSLTDQLGQSSLILQSEKLASAEHTDIWKTLIRGWLENVVVRVDYIKAKTTEPITHEIEPLLFEPAILSHGTYLIAWSRSRNALRPFKISRIQRAVLTTANFEPHPDLDIDDLLKHAWGIWYGEEPVKVELLFATNVAERVQETVRHPSETITILEDGSLYWTVEIVGIQELVAWIRGWGPAVEVLAPTKLRDWIAADMRAAAALYEESR